MRKFLTFLFATCLTVGAWALQKPLPSLHVEGKWLVDTYGNHVVLHGVMDTPSMYFNSNRWQGGYNEQGAINCRAYFNKLFDGMHQANCDVFRLHLDPAWTNDNNYKYIDQASQPQRPGFPGTIEEPILVHRVVRFDCQVGRASYRCLLAHQDQAVASDVLDGQTDSHTTFT